MASAWTTGAADITICALNNNGFVTGINDPNDTPCYVTYDESTMRVTHLNYSGSDLTFLKYDSWAATPLVLVYAAFDKSVIIDGVEYSMVGMGTCGITYASLFEFELPTGVTGKAYKPVGNDTGVEVPIGVSNNGLGIGFNSPSSNGFGTYGIACPTFAVVTRLDTFDNAGITWNGCSFYLSVDTPETTNIRLIPSEYAADPYKYFSETYDYHTLQDLGGGELKAIAAKGTASFVNYRNGGIWKKR